MKRPIDSTGYWGHTAANMMCQRLANWLAYKLPKWREYVPTPETGIYLGPFVQGEPTLTEIESVVRDLERSLWQTLGAGPAFTEADYELLAKAVFVVQHLDLLEKARARDDAAEQQKALQNVGRALAEMRWNNEREPTGCEKVRAYVAEHRHEHPKWSRNQWADYIRDNGISELKDPRSCLKNFKPE